MEREGYEFEAGCSSIKLTSISFKWLATGQPTGTRGEGGRGRGASSGNDN